MSKLNCLAMSLQLLLPSMVIVLIFLLQGRPRLALLRTESLLDLSFMVLCETV